MTSILSTHNEGQLLLGHGDLHPCERKQSLPAWYPYTFVYSKVLFLCQVSRADILAQLWQYRQRRRGVMGHRPAISQQHWHASHCRMMNGHTHMPHICSCTHMTHIHVQKHTGNPPGQVNQALALHHTHTDIHKHTHTKTDRRPYCSAALFRARCRRKGE